MLTPCLNFSHDWLESREFKIKEVVFDPHFAISNSPILVKSRYLKSKYLVSVLVWLSFGKLVRMTKEKLQKRFDILKMIAGSYCGCTNGTLSETYKAVGWSFLICGAGVLASKSGSQTRTTCKHNKTLIFTQLLAALNHLASMIYKIRLKCCLIKLAQTR